MRTRNEAPTSPHTSNEGVKNLTPDNLMADNSAMTDGEVTVTVTDTTVNQTDGEPKEPPEPATYTRSGNKGKAKNGKKPQPSPDALPFPIAFVQFTKQLSNMQDWFLHYGKKYSEDDFTATTCMNIDDDFRNAATRISELAGWEFLQRQFYRTETYKPEKP